MRHHATQVMIFVCFFAAGVTAHEAETRPCVVIDTDMGLDDVVTLAMALQAPGMDLAAVVACDGTMSGQRAVESLECMLEEFNRSDVRLYAPADRKPVTAPPFRPFAEKAVTDALPAIKTSRHHVFAPEAYVCPGRKTIVLLLGPPGNLATAIQARPDIAAGIAEVLIAGSPEPQQNWNVRQDSEAMATLYDTPLHLEFVITNDSASKPRSWNQTPLRIGQGTSIGESFLQRLLMPDRVRTHYLKKFGPFFDELVLLHVLAPNNFSEKRREDIVVIEPTAHEKLIQQMTDLISRGRQHRQPVVLAETVIPEQLLREDVRQRQAGIVSRNGQDEWFAQLLMNEMHEHLGAYSVIGVKMGLRAAEQLNAPPHGMEVISHAAATPPVSCLNDGLIIATGSTPGRGLFSHVPGPKGSTEVTFRFNGRSLTLMLKPEFAARIRQVIRDLLTQYTLNDPEYWSGVRRFGLELWEHWHRRDLFQIVDAPRDSADNIPPPAREQ